MNELDQYFLDAVAQETRIARIKYPGNAGRYVAFTAEAGEVFHEMQKILTGRGTHDNMRFELIQVAAMALRLYSESDPMLERS